MNRIESEILLRLYPTGDEIAWEVFVGGGLHAYGYEHSEADAKAYAAAALVRLFMIGDARLWREKENRGETEA